MTRCLDAASVTAAHGQLVVPHHRPHERTCGIDQPGKDIAGQVQPGNKGKEKPIVLVVVGLCEELVGRLASNIGMRTILLRSHLGGA
jgi:hypothetical protein